MFNLMFKLIYNKSSLNKSAKIAYVNTQYTLCIQLARKEAGGGGWSNFREEFKIGLRNNFLRYFKYYFRIQFELRRGKNAIQSSGEWIRIILSIFFIKNLKIFAVRRSKMTFNRNSTEFYADKYDFNVMVSSVFYANIMASKALHSELLDELSGRFSSRNEYFRISEVRIVHHFFEVFGKFGISKLPNFGNSGYYRKISELRKPNISETRENEKFGNFRLMQGLNGKFNFTDYLIASM